MAAAATASALVLSGGPVAVHWLSQTPRTATVEQARAFSSASAVSLLGTGKPGAGPLASGGTTAPAQLSGPTRGTGQPTHITAADAPERPVYKPKHAAPAAPPPPVYQNPLRSVSGLIPERIDMGIDFGGSGPVYALGDAVVTNAQGDNGGWPGGGWITYRLTSGPDAGLMVYLAEDVTPTVQPGQHVTSSTVIANMYDGGDGIETGWAMPDGASAESQLPEAGGISGNGPFPTMIGLNFEELLQSLGVPAGNNRDQTAYGTLPPNYPANGG